jgi:uncharacterized protein YlzI (FlbEa/FlbD family)
VFKLHTVGGEDIYINERFVESIEATSESDTTVRIHDGTTFVTEESPEELMMRIMEWHKHVVCAERRPETPASKPNEHRLPPGRTKTSGRQ